MPKRGFLTSISAIILSLCMCFWPLTVNADGIADRSLELANSSTGITTDYTLSFTITTSSNLGSMDVLFCSNSPLQDDTCDSPAGMDVTHAQFKAASGITSVTLFPVTTNEMLLSWGSTSISPPLAVSFTFSDIVSPSDRGAYYARLSTYASSNGTGPAVGFGGLAFALTNNLLISSYVPPYLTFCSGLSIPSFDCSSATGDYINFGGLAPSRSSQSASQLLVATNAPGGYTVQVVGTTMTSGNNIIAAITGLAGTQPGTPQFGINLRANSAPPVGGDPAGPGSGLAAPGYDTANRFRFVSNEIVASSLAADDWRRYTVSYLVNVPGSQAPGVYASTLTYVCAGSF